ncbi:hypothetical protein HPB49_010675 [Dermacentor silvarum]|uniref:Uncharacterized protein n=1 Tax=Dermacentor silvarum TaxID=543639 RepID=A0ACB8CEP8_DERSI|nr:hypothetical protein HPB49_010675 [Dermacentor silvarum]
MLRNLATSEQRRLLDCYNNIWWSGQVPEAWRTAIVAPILKSNKPANELSSYRPVSLTSAACKVMEAIALARLEWVARACGFLADQQTGFRRRRCTADSIADVVSTLEDARASGDLAMLLLIDVKGAFDGLPHAVVQHALDLLGIGGNLRRFLSSFLNDRTLRVRVGHARSTPQKYRGGYGCGFELKRIGFGGCLVLTCFAQRPAVGRRVCRASQDALSSGLARSLKYQQLVGGVKSSHSIHPATVARSSGTRLANLTRWRLAASAESRPLEPRRCRNGTMHSLQQHKTTWLLPADVKAASCDTRGHCRRKRLVRRITAVRERANRRRTLQTCRGRTRAVDVLAIDVLMIVARSRCQQPWRPTTSKRSGTVCSLGGSWVMASSGTIDNLARQDSDAVQQIQ